MEVWNRMVEPFTNYEVSSLGRIKSWRTRKPHVIQPHARSHGKRGFAYLSFNAKRDDGSVITVKVHIWVALAFHGPRPAGMVVKHKDDDKYNNCSANLSYGTQSSNVKEGNVRRRALGKQLELF